MIRTYVAQIENRVETVKDLIGEQPEVYQKNANEVKQKVDGVLKKLIANNNLQNKQYNQLNAFINKHSDVLDNKSSLDKTNILIDELDDLKETAQKLKKIDSLLPALDTSNYIEQRSKFNNIEYLGTTSSIKLNQKNDSIEVTNYQSTPLRQLQKDEKQEMSSIMELNYRMLNNLNRKIQLAYERKKKQ